VFLQEAFNVMW
jgi:hypothetical protein